MLCHHSVVCCTLVGSDFFPTYSYNLSTFVICLTLSVVLTTWQSAVFLLNSRLTHFTATPSFLLPAEMNFGLSNADCRLFGSARFRATNSIENRKSKIYNSLLFAGGKKEGAPLLPKLR